MGKEIERIVISKDNYIKHEFFEEAIMNAKLKFSKRYPGCKLIIKQATGTATVIAIENEIQKGDAR